MATLNREVFARDPLTWAIPNDGVAKVQQPTQPQEWQVLRHELTSFVCDGEYRRGLVRILTAYLQGLGQPVQPAAWVSGFYGSGKSHFVRVLEYLWRNIEIPDTGGQRARNLVTLTPDVNELLSELSTQGARRGGLWSAAGKLESGSGASVRLALLAVLFRAAGLPDQYPAARLVLRLKKTPGLYDAVAAGVAARGSSLADELFDMYVS
ncbi:MAG: BREX system P-loop protein BrxC, partial [Dehalococcoidia bacterium]